MRLPKWCWCVGVACVLAPAASSQWLDDFDSYTSGKLLAAQSNWEEWTGKSGVDALVSASQSFTKQNSVLIVTSNDVVYDFSNLTAGRPTKGVWTLSIKTMVPLGATGMGWYIVMNDYPTNLNWSVQTVFDAGTGMVSDGSASKRIKFGKWTSLVVAVDLDNNRYDSWYDDKPLAVNHVWYGSGGMQQIAALDLYGDTAGCSGVYFDEARLEKTAGGALALTSSPNPISAGINLTLYSQSPFLGNGDVGALFNWSLNGSPLIFLLMPTSYDATGTWTLKTNIPPGLSGLEAGLKMFALTSGKQLLMSNEDLIIFL